MDKNRDPSEEGLEQTRERLMRFNVSGRRERPPGDPTIRIELRGVENQVWMEIEDLQERIRELEKGGSSLELNEARERLRQLERKPAYFAHGGTLWGPRPATRGEWPAFPKDMMESRHGLGAGVTALGVGVIGEKRFIIFREIDNQTGRTGGYPLVVLFDPGEVVWRMAKWNGAAIMRRITLDSELSRAIIYNPESLDEFGAFDKIIRKLQISELTTERKSDPAINRIMHEAASAKQVRTIGPSEFPNKPLGELAENLSSVPPDDLQNATYLFGGYESMARFFGARIVWDPDKK